MAPFSKVNGATGSPSPKVRLPMQVKKLTRALGQTPNVRAREHPFLKLQPTKAIGKKVSSMAWASNRFQWMAPSVNIKASTNSGRGMVRGLTNGRTAPRIKGSGKITLFTGWALIHGRMGAFMSANGTKGRCKA